MKRTIAFLGFLAAGSFAARAQDVMRVTNGASVTVMENASIYIEGGLSLESNTHLANQGTIVLTKNDFTDQTQQAYAYGSGKIIFRSNSLQRINTRNTIGRLEVDNEGLQLLSDINASQWDLKNGVIQTGNYYAVVSGSTAGAVAADESNKNYSRSWFNGNLRRYIDPHQADQYLFPVGDDRRVKYCELAGLNREPLTGVHYVDASFARPAVLNNTSSLRENNFVYTGINKNGMWKLVPDAVPVSGKFDLRVSLADFSGLDDNHFALLGQNADSWQVPAGSVLPAESADGRTLMGGFALRNNLGSFGNYAIGMMQQPEKDNAFAVKVFPDPVTDYQFFVQLSNCELKGLKLFTMDGHELQAGSVVLKNNQVKVTLPPNFAKGTYSVQLYTDKGLRTAKIIVL
ncbi:MAG: T9SS type A sorting domain-containing protein [Ferruginibacter sp.]